MSTERRYLPQARAEVRMEGEEQKLIGYAAVFHRDDAPQEFELWEGFIERIMPGAFDRALSESHDVRALFNHSPDYLLGRTAAGTCRLSVDQTGLRYEIDTPDTQCGRDTLQSVSRGDLSGSSFAMVPRKVTYQEVDEITYRLVEDVDLIDVGPVTFPAYTGTSAGVRSEDRSALEAELREWRQVHGNHSNALTEVEVEFLYRQRQQDQFAVDRT